MGWNLFRVSESPLKFVLVYTWIYVHVAEQMYATAVVLVSPLSEIVIQDHSTQKMTSID